MTFEEFLNNLASKIGPKNTFDLHQDAQLSVLRKLLIEKGIFSEEEFNNTQEAELDLIAEKILKFKQTPKEDGKK